MTFDPAAVRAQFPIFNDRGRPLHYLDSAAMAQTPQVVIDAVSEHEATARANVRRGLYPLAEAADSAFEAARATVAGHLGASGPDEIVFTGGCTAAINLVAQALATLLQHGDEIVVSRLEHHSNLIPWLMLRERHGIAVRFLPVSRDGRIDMAALSEAVGPRCRLIALAHASNVTGAVTDVAAVVAAARAVGAHVLLDGAQMIAHRPIDVRALDVDFYAFSGHKVFGPTGIGILWGRREILQSLPPVAGGGGMVREVGEGILDYSAPPFRFEAGTPPVAQAVGLAAALRWLEGIDRAAADVHETRLAGRLLDGLRSIAGVRIIGPDGTAGRVPVVSFAVEGAHPHDVCQVLAERHVYVRGGAHCAQPLMAALGIDGTVRASLSLTSDEADIFALFDGLKAARTTLT